MLPHKSTDDINGACSLYRHPGLNASETNLHSRQNSSERFLMTYSAVDSSGRYGNLSAGWAQNFTCQSKSLVLVLRDHKMASFTQIEMEIELKLVDRI